MVVELINTGSELMLGRVLNTHQQWLCRQLADSGFVVSRQVAVPDTSNDIAQAVRESLSRADLVITTGGLGPTSDDLTRETIAEMLNCPLHEDQDVLAQIKGFFDHRNRPMPDRTRVEARVPRGATVLPNLNGTAPGLAMEVAPGTFRSATRSSWLIMLPGPPRELQPMYLESVLPLLRRVLPATCVFICQTVRTLGLGESVLQDRIEKQLEPLVSAGLEVGYCARPGLVDVRLVAHGDRAEQLVEAAASTLRAELGHHLYANGDETIEATIVRMLIEKKQTLALAESCTGGCIADRITDVPGASAMLKGAFVTYCNTLKHTCLGVRRETLAEHGAVSEPVAREMAEGARRVADSDYALSVTGIAGPGGGSEEKPVGTVFIGLASSTGTQVWRMINPWDRRTFKDVTAQQALNFLRLRLLSDGAAPPGE